MACLYGGPVRFDELLAITQKSDGEFVAQPPGEGFLFGGLSLGLVLRASAATAATEMVPKSLHGYFLRPGRWEGPTTLRVEQLSNGRSFAARRADVEQEGRLLASFAASFHQPGEGFDWQADDLASLPTGPDDLVPVTVMLSVSDLIEVRPVQPARGTALTASVHPYWARSVHPLGEDQILHCAALAFISDYLVILSILTAGLTVTQPTSIRTVDHGVWFHRPVKADDWLLYASDPVSISAGRGFARGSIRSLRGELVASFSQEVVIPS
jgi:acyl-CoA thioesterase-2